MTRASRLTVSDPQITSPPGRPRGALLRASDKQTGNAVGAVSGRNCNGEYVAFALPNSEVRPTSQP